MRFHEERVPTVVILYGVLHIAIRVPLVVYGILTKFCASMHLFGTNHQKERRAIRPNRHVGLNKNFDKQHQLALIGYPGPTTAKLMKSLNVLIRVPLTWRPVNFTRFECGVA